jgi:hypothetical protein
VSRPPVSGTATARERWLNGQICDRFGSHVEAFPSANTYSIAATPP